MLLPSIVGALTLATSVQGFFRLPCDNPVIIERADPIIAPNAVSGHVHTVSGASNFSPFSTFADLRKSDCTSCRAIADKSAYWTPQLYFQWKNGSFTSVPLTGGGLIYYLFRSNPKDKTKVTAFPDGFKVLAGNPFLRTYNASSLQAQAIGWNCLGGPDPTTGETRNPWLPKVNCPDGLRGEVRLPSCWDGKNVYKADQSHMAYSDGESGPCPATHPTRLVTLFYEMLYSVNDFKDVWAQAKNPRSPFVLAMGDPTGYGMHGDFATGWDRSILTKAIATCTSDSGVIEECKVLKLYDRSKDGDCRKTPDVNEVVTGTLSKLPGCNSVTTKTVTPGACSSPVPAFFSKPIAYTGKYPPPGSQVTTNSPQVLSSYSTYRFQGCFSDASSAGRALPVLLSPTKKSVGACILLAKLKGYSFVGMEWGSECWAAKSLASTSKPISYTSCNMVCPDSPLQICGGSNALTLYKV